MTDASETVAVFAHHDHTFEIDHLGIGYTDQWGTYAIYEVSVDGSASQVGEFASDASWLKPELAPPLPTTQDLIGMAIQTLEAEICHD